MFSAVAVNHELAESTAVVQLRSAETRLKATQKTYRAGSAVARVAVALAGAGVAGAVLWSADIHPNPNVVAVMRGGHQGIPRSAGSSLPTPRLGTLGLKIGLWVVVRRTRETW
jgi:hypothetical protein